MKPACTQPDLRQVADRIVEQAHTFPTANLVAFGRLDALGGEAVGDQENIVRRWGHIQTTPKQSQPNGNAYQQHHHSIDVSLNLPISYKL